MNKHRGSTLEEWLKEEGLLDMTNPNKWIPIEKAYPPNGHAVEALIDGKICNAIFNDHELCRSWTIKKEEYEGVSLPTAWRFPQGTLGIVLKVDWENETSEELGFA